MPVAVTQSEIDAYSADGVVLLRQAIPLEWIEALRRGVEKNLFAPSDRGRLWNRAGDGSTTFYDSQAWQGITEYQEFVLESPMAELAGTVMDCAADTIPPRRALLVSQRI